VATIEHRRSQQLGLMKEKHHTTATDFMDTCNTGYLEVAPWGSWRPSAEVAPLCQVRAGTRAEKAERCRGKAHRLASETRSLAVWVVEVIALCQRSGVRAPMIHLQEDLHAGMSLLKCVWTQHVQVVIRVYRRVLARRALASTLVCELPRLGLDLREEWQAFALAVQSVQRQIYWRIPPVHQVELGLPQPRPHLLGQGPCVVLRLLVLN